MIFLESQHLKTSRKFTPPPTIDYRSRPNRTFLQEITIDYRSRPNRTFLREIGKSFCSSHICCANFVKFTLKFRISISSPYSEFPHLYTLQYMNLEL